MFQTKVLVFEKAVILEHLIFLSVDTLNLRQGPYFFEGRLTGQVYANFLQNVLPQSMEDVPLHVRMWMEHVDATRRYTTPLCSVFKTSDK